MTSSGLLGPLLQVFFTDYLNAQKRASLETIASYRDTFRLLLRFVHQETGVEPAQLTIPELHADIILRFLDSLERDRSNSTASRNLRLTAIRSFYRMVALRDPTSVGVAMRVLAIPMKRTDIRIRHHLDRDEMEAILAAIDRRTWCGRRDYALLLTMYNSGARVSELATLRQGQVIMGGKTYVQVHGKGRKDRMIPLWPRTAAVLKEWFRELGKQDQAMAFPSVRREPLSRFAIHLLLRKAVRKAVLYCPTLSKKRISPHVVRHSTAMALLESGVDIAVIALWLGHESIGTTNAYLHASLAMKEKALAKMEPVGTRLRRFHARDKLLAFLETI